MLSVAYSAEAKHVTAARLAPQPERLEELFCAVPRETFESGEGVFWEGDAADHVFKVSEGVLRVFKIIADGRRVITGFLYAGDFVGLSLKDRYLYSAEAVTPVRLRRLARKPFQEALEKWPELRPQFFARVCDEMATAQDQMVLLSRKSAEERVATFLMLLARRLHGCHPIGRRIHLPMSRLDMADYLGLTIETVSRTLTKLVARGVISPEGRHDFAISKPGKLLALCGDGDSYDYEETIDRGPKMRQAIWPH